LNKTKTIAETKTYAKLCLKCDNVNHCGQNEKVTVISCFSFRPLDVKKGLIKARFY